MGTKKKKKPTKPQPTPTPEAQPLVDPVPTSQVQMPVMSSITTVAPPITALSPPVLSTVAAPLTYATPMVEAVSYQPSFAPVTQVLDPLSYPTAYPAQPVYMQPTL